jgi:hypothetical protein
MSTPQEPSWIEANRAFLAREFQRLKGLFGSAGGSDEDTPEHPFWSQPAPAAIEHLAQLFGLSDFERHILLLAAGVEMDSALADQCRQVQGHPMRPVVTFGLAMATLGDPHWSALTPGGPLRRFRLLELEPGHGLSAAPLRIDERILHYLAGVNEPDVRLHPLVEPSAYPEWIADGHRAVAEQATKAWATEPVPLLHFCGDDPQGQEDVASVVAAAAGCRPFTVRAEDLPALGQDLDQLALLWEREALLLPGALLIQCESAGLTPSARHLAERLPGMVAISLAEPVRLIRPFLRFEVNKPGPAEQKGLWEKALGPAARYAGQTLDDLSEQFRLSAKTIYTSGSLARAANGTLDPLDLWNLCRSAARPRIENLAQRLVPQAVWDDLVLPPQQTQTLRHLASQVRRRMQVYEEWGFAARGRRGLGVSALFSGDSGTGKTMAAEVLAHELALDLYRIDLSAVVSKYIGETEKNLKQVFDAAEEGGALLLFDEADALFGKRADVKDSHDRYANIEVGYLLQRMEAYQGLAILTTNMKSALDRAFQRRLRFTIQFPFPDAAQREAIWKRIFPPDAPIYGLDPKKLAQLNLTGGNIRNIALNAAFLASAEGKPVEMKHLLEAARLEAQKIDRPLSEAEIRGWV